MEHGTRSRASRHIRDAAFGCRYLGECKHQSITPIRYVLSLGIVQFP